MIRSTVRFNVAILLLPLLSVGPLTAQRGDPAAGMTAQTRAQLWPERELSPAEQELKDHVIVLRDSLAGVNAAAALVQRQVRARNSSAVVRSSSNSLQGQCDRSMRASGVMKEYSLTIATDDEKWGQPAVRGFRNALADLEKNMTQCSEQIGRLDFPDADSGSFDEVGLIALEARKAITSYTSVVNGLLNTLQVSIEVRGRYGRSQ